MRSALRRGGRNPGSGADPALFHDHKAARTLFAKGRILGIQFDTLFTDDLYLHIGESALDCAAAIKSALKENGYQFFLETPTNQIFIILETKSCTVWKSRRNSASGKNMMTPIP